MEHLHGAYLKVLNHLHHVCTGKHAVFDPAEKKKEDRIDRKQWTKLEFNFGLASDEPPDYRGEPMCERPMFEGFIGVLVMINAITMALELDFANGDAIWVILDMAFCVVFLGEIVFRVYCLGLYNFFKQPRYIADFVLVAFNVADTGVTLSGAESTGLQSFSALRILRLFKIMKLLRLISHVKELSLIATGLASALKSLQWVSLLLAVVIFVMAVMFKILMGRECVAADVQVAFAYRFPDVDPIVKCEEFWGTVIRSMYTLYQITTLESWSEVLVRPIFDARPAYVFIILIFQLVTTFGLLNIVVAAIVDGTMNSVDEAVVENQTKKRVATNLKVLRDIFLQATEGGATVLTQETLLPILLKPDNRRKLLLLNIEFDDPSQIWRIVDSDETGQVDIAAFTTNLMRMRGAAKAKDLLAIRSQIYRTSREVVTKVDAVQAMIEKIQPGSPQPPALPAETPSAPSASSNAAPDGAALERFQQELKNVVGQLSVEVQGQLRSFRSDMSKDIDSRLNVLESNVFQVASSLQHATLGTTAGELLVEPPQVPREQRLPSMPARPCCNVLVGSNDRSVIEGSNVEVVAMPTPQPFVPIEGASVKLAQVLSSDHQNMISDLEQKHQQLLSRLNLGLPLADALKEAPEVLPKATEAEPKFAQAKPSSSSTQTASTQTDPVELQVAAPLEVSEMLPSCMNVGDDKAGSVINEDEADRILEATEKRDVNEKNTFAQALEDHKNAEKSRTSHMEAFVTGPIFEGFFAFLITANAAIMALEVQYTGVDIGVDLAFPGSTTRASETWHGAKEAFSGLELFFGIIFVLELIFKVGVLKVKFIHSLWNWMDTMIVLGWVLDSAIGIGAFLNPMLLRLFRLVKLLRVAKLFKSFQAFDSLSILIGSMKASVSVLFWSVIVLFTAQTAASLLLSQGLESFLAEPSRDERHRKQQLEVYEFFGTFIRSFITTMQLTIGNWVPVCRLLFENVHGGWGVFVCLYIIFIHFGAIKVISAVFLVETQKVAATDEELLILQKERQINRLIRNFAGVFKEIDSSNDGLVDWDEFQNVIHDHRVLTWLAALDLDIEQCEGMFALLNGGDGKISFQEFVKGVQRLKGGAKAIDLTMLMNRHAELTQTVVHHQRKIEQHISQVGQLR